MIKKSYFIGAALAFGLLITSCGDGKQKDGSEAGAEIEKKEEVAEDISKPLTAKFKSDTILKVYKNYLLIKDALVEEKISEVKDAANNIVEAYGAKASDNEVALRAKRIAGSGNIFEQRDHFSGLTKAMDEVLKANISAGKIHKQYCPMAFGGKGGYWYSNEEQIRNPYYGDKMLKCGRIEETIQ
ncbi:DUF3347 domain-containing protein [Christiangramia salexigens]|uniref:DUF3347 domain-containing protein n=1 Tax=Christiangramia salexigens TaxID=1913577 RepID=A0A1L3J7H5_9FLAO|nr:DUF3347 domain-containing protein [Christiangramia salexigens]APG61087.1 hypothetical protein LPB144_12010 [Christiangramia salexigens]